MEFEGLSGSGSKAVGHSSTKSQDTLLLLSAVQRVMKDPVVKMAPRTRKTLTDWVSKTEAFAI